jgi:hypothetical protein
MGSYHLTCCRENNGNRVRQPESISFGGSVWANDRITLNSAYAIDLL